MEIDLLIDYPKGERVRGRKDVEKALRFGQDYFDGGRECGYGGYTYHEKFFAPVARLMTEFYRLKRGSRVLDLGCAKGFLLYEFQRLGMDIRGLDISEYAISKAPESVMAFLEVGDLRDRFFMNADLIVSLGTLHNLEIGPLIRVLRRMSVLGNKSFITVDAYRDEAERQRMMDWNLTAKTILHVDDWKGLFEEVGYTGDYFWIFP